jgi:hypothetical protein
MSGAVRFAGAEKMGVEDNPIVNIKDARREGG